MMNTINHIYYLHGFVPDKKPICLEELYKLDEKLRNAQAKLNPYYEKSIINDYKTKTYHFNPFKKHKFVLNERLQLNGLNLNWLKLYEVLIRFSIVRDRLSFYSDEQSVIKFIANKLNMTVYFIDYVDVYIYNLGITNFETVYQEQDYYKLLCQKIHEMKLQLITGGTFIIKLYTILRKDTINLVAELVQLFKQVFVYKPYSTNPSNSETYLICLQYTPMIPLKPPTQNWIDYLYYIQKCIVDYQIKNINLEISAYETYKNKNRIPFSFGNNRNQTLINAFDDISSTIESIDETDYEYDESLE